MQANVVGLVCDIGRALCPGHRVADEKSHLLSGEGKTRRVISRYKVIASHATGRRGGDLINGSCARAFPSSIRHHRIGVKRHRSIYQNTHKGENDEQQNQREFHQRLARFSVRLWTIVNHYHLSNSACARYFGRKALHSPHILVRRPA